MKTKAITTIMLTVLLASLLSTTVTSVLAVKPTGNLAGAEKVLWNLSGDVMPVPPWGLRDIPGSETASKLIINQPNGNTEVAITGAMNGLDPDTQYIVYISNGWTTKDVWDVTGTWVITVNDGTYPHDYTFSMTSLWDGTFTGVGGYPAGAIDYTFDEIVIDGQITGNTITFTAVYYQDSIPTGYSWTATGTIALDGTMSGTGTSGVYEWHSTIGAANSVPIGAGWPGLFHTLQTFPFMTDEFGSGSWHLNLRNEDFPSVGEYTFSVWINGLGGTILISDNFTVDVD